MTIEEEHLDLREENKYLREPLAQRDERIQQLEAGLEQQNVLMQQMQEPIGSLTQQGKSLPERQGKDSHKSSLPPSSDRFTRKTKSLRKKSEKKSGGQEGHQGVSLQWSSTPDEMIEKHVEQCEACQHDWHEVPACHVERRQVHDVPPPRPIVQEYRAEQKQCPVCQHITAARFPQEVPAPIPYGPTIGAVAVYLVQQQLLPLARAAEVMRDLLGVQMKRRDHLHPDPTLCHQFDGRRAADQRSIGQGRCVSEQTNESFRHEGRNEYGVERAAVVPENTSR